LNDRSSAKYGIGKDVIIVEVLCVTHFFILPSFRVVAITPSDFFIVLTWLYRFRVEVIGLVMGKGVGFFLYWVKVTRVGDRFLGWYEG